MRRVALHGRNICDEALSQHQGHTAPPPAASAQHALPDAPDPPPHTRPPQPPPHARPPPARKPATQSEDGPTTATLIPYCSRLIGVRLSDELTSKAALTLLFQLVQWQMRKAERYKEARCCHLRLCAPRVVAAGVLATSGAAPAAYHGGSCVQGLPRACKRCLAGMKEVTWAVGKPERTKLVLLAPNIQIPSPDSSLLTQVLELVHKCHEAGVPVIMGPTRKQLGMAFRTSGAPDARACGLLA